MSRGEVSAHGYRKAVIMPRMLRPYIYFALWMRAMGKRPSFFIVRYGARLTKTHSGSDSVAGGENSVSLYLAAASGLAGRHCSSVRRMLITPEPR